MANRRRSLPPVSPKIAAELRPLVAAISEIIEVGEGVRGDPLDRKLTFRDLLDSGIGQLRNGAGANTPGALQPTTPPPNLSTPPRPTNFNAIGGFNGSINLTWDGPRSLYSNHAYTNIYRAEADNFANAALVGREDGGFYTDYRRDDAAPTPYYYWITFTSTSDIEGPTNATAGTLAQALFDPDYIIEQISGLISESELADELLTPIQTIPGIQSHINTVGQQVDDNSAAVQTKAEAQVVTDLSGEVTSIKARYSIKLDVNGRMSGLIFGDNGIESSLVIASNSMLFIDPDQSATPFNPATDYSSMDAVRNSQLVFGYAKVEGMNRFVINAPAYIPEGYITKGQIGAVGFGSIEAADGTPITTVQGRLKADYIDADNLRVAVAATFDGTAQSGNYEAGVSGWRLLQDGTLEAQNATIKGHVEMNTGYIASGVSIGGLGSFAYKSSLFYNDVAGTKPPSNADVTGSNTAYDTARVSGSAASYVRSWALNGNSAKGVTNNWTRPGQTLIDGNKIFTGDAYVDTLQIKGNAVTVAQGAQAGSFYTSSIHGPGGAAMSYNSGHNASIPGIVQVTLTGRGREDQYYGPNSPPRELDISYQYRVVIVNTIIGTGTLTARGTRYTTMTAFFKCTIPAGNVSIYLQVAANGGQVGSSSMTVLGGKR